MSLEIWKRAVPLHKAIVKALPSSLRTELQELQKKSQFKIFEEGTKTAQADGKTGFDIFISALKGPQELSSRISDIKAISRGRIYSWVKSGDVRVYGYELPRSLNSEPVEISSDLLLSVPQWLSTEGEFRHQGIHIAELRIISTKAIKELENDATRSITASVEPQAPGRPSFKSDIKRAYFALKQAGELDFSRSMKSQYVKFRKWLHAASPDRYPTENHPGDEVLRRTIKSLIEK